MHVLHLHHTLLRQLRMDEAKWKRQLDAQLRGQQQQHHAQVGRRAEAHPREVSELDLDRRRLTRGVHVNHVQLWE